jgi:hypothetical protein
LDNWVDGLRLNTTDTLTFVCYCNFDVTSITPCSPPRVSYDIIFFTSFIDTITNSSDSVVQLLQAAGVVEDTACVHLKRGLPSIKHDRDGTQSNGSHKLRTTVGLDSPDFGDTDFTWICGRVAGSVFGSVSVVFAEILLIGLEICECTAWVSSLATIRCSVAINKLLLGKIKEFL